MIPSPLRRALLLLAVAAFLITRAAAQNADAAFASALREGAPSFARIAQFKAKPRKPVPQTKGPSASEAVWAKVLETVKRDGKYRPDSAFAPGSFSIEDTVGDPKADHSTQGISVFGMLNDEERFEALSVMLVFRDHKLDPKDGNWHIEQWLFQTDVYGEVAELAAGTVIKTQDGKVVGTTRSAISPSDPKVQARYDAMLAHWAERKP
ncbi:MAG: hypothetical protein HYV14_09990 [Elusimicrobia bacterium]|nr:hypothetical protein [Elusimicrobiota bacterium]